MCVSLRQAIRQRLYNFAGLSRTDERSQLFERGFTYALHTLEMAQQRIARLPAYTFNTIERRHYLLLAALVAMVGDTKAVGLIAQMLNEAQRLGIFV